MDLRSVLPRECCFCLLSVSRPGRASEMAEAKLKDVETNPRGEHWTRVKGKGRKSGKVARMQLAWNALSQYRLARGPPVDLYA